MKIIALLICTGAPDPGGQGGQLPTQLLDPYVLSYATSFLTLFSACPPSFKLLPRSLYDITSCNLLPILYDNFLQF